MLMPFIFGLIALFTWLYATGADRWALRLMWVGLLYCLLASVLTAVPELVWMSGGDDDWQSVIVMILIAPIIEELVKSHASRSQKMAVRSFALVCLFGVYELMLSKPLMMTETQAWPSFIEALETLPALTMHILTAAIYAFALKGNRAGQTTLCVIIHATFNGLWVAGLFYLMPIVSALAVFISFWLFTKRGRQTSSQSTS